MLGLTVTGSILLITLVEKFSDGGWVTVMITSMVVLFCLLIRKHYDSTKLKLREIEKIFAQSIKSGTCLAKKLDAELPTAVIMVDENRGVGIHTIMWVLRLFPGHFKNFIFLCVGEVDTQSFDSEATIRSMQYRTENTLCYYASFCEQQGLESTWKMAYGTDSAQALDDLAQQVYEEYPNSVFFAAKLIFANDNLLVRWLHNQTSLSLQRRLHQRGQQVVILPMKIN